MPLQASASQSFLSTGMTHKAAAAVVGFSVIAGGLLGFQTTKSQQWEWFSYHPQFMMVGTGLIVAGTLLKKLGGLENTRNHGILASTGVLCNLFALYVIYGIKGAYNKPHFATYHGQAGALTCFSLFVLMLVGGVALHPDFGLLRSKKDEKGGGGKLDKTPALAKTVRQAHHSLGKAVGALMCAVCCTGIVTKIQGMAMRVAYVTPIAAMAVAIFI